MTAPAPSGWLVGSSKGACRRRRRRRRRPKADAHARAPPDQGAACLVRLPGVSRRRRWWWRLFRTCYVAFSLSLSLAAFLSFPTRRRESFHFHSTTNFFGDGCACAGGAVCGRAARWSCFGRLESVGEDGGVKPATGCCVWLLSGRLLQFLFDLSSGVGREAVETNRSIWSARTLSHPIMPSTSASPRRP
ncbi:hypothetical protein IWX90DRAFT_6575 [Phyllosticta citrichinensis]|uniref:Uncharacterized protein n=1 Tax=Phyllosticta citrichinensis TaxID=1130410 RepID=A0ABR1Y5A5_9PEZI